MILSSSISKGKVDNIIDYILLLLRLAWCAQLEYQSQESQTAYSATQLRINII